MPLGMVEPDTAGRTHLTTHPHRESRFNPVHPNIALTNDLRIRIVSPYCGDARKVASGI
jgi:hypothetical protein